MPPPTFDHVAWRYQNDALFHSLVDRLRLVLGDGRTSAPTLRDAVRLAIALNAIDAERRVKDAEEAWNPTRGKLRSQRE